MPFKLFKWPFITALAMLMPLAAASPATAQETVEYYGLDALGSVRVIFDEQGNVVDRMDYGPFGENLRAAIRFPVEQFAQLARDSESNQDYAQARNYSAGTGRFSRVDPVYAGLFQPQRWNRYAYARNSPLMFSDPRGLAERCGGTEEKPKFCTTIDGEYTNEQPLEWDEGTTNFFLYSEWCLRSGCGYSFGFAGGNATGGQVVVPPPPVPPRVPTFPEPPPPPPAPPPGPTGPKPEPRPTFSARVKSLGGLLGGYLVNYVADNLPCGTPRASLHAVSAGFEIVGTYHAVAVSASSAVLAVGSAPSVGPSLMASASAVGFGYLAYQGARETNRQLQEVNRNLHCS